MKKLTLVDFLARSRERHGDKYDYSKTVIFNARTKVLIDCPVHGEFSQESFSHMKGIGCRKCGRDAAIGKRLMSQEAVLNKFKEVHGDAYDYSAVDYRGDGRKVRIICRKHGSFWQSPANHKARHGCPDCGIEKCTHKQTSLSTDKFIKKARSIHGSNYDYSEVRYLKSTGKVVIRCPMHGPFIQQASSHLQGRGCPKCSRIKGSSSRRLKFEDFLVRAKALYGDAYSYAENSFRGVTSKMAMMCPKHGAFHSRPADFLRGGGCPKCRCSRGERIIGMVLTRLGIEHRAQYINRHCKDIHPLKFDYALLKGDELIALIEYNGNQHYRQIGFQNADFISIQRRDHIKEEFCTRNKIPFLAIPYWDFPNLEKIVRQFCVECKGNAPIRNFLPVDRFSVSEGTGLNENVFREYRSRLIPKNSHNTGATQLFQEMKADIEKDYYNLMPLSEISAKYSIGRKIIEAQAKKHGWKRARGTPQAFVFRKHLEEIKSDYANGVSLGVIAETFGLPINSVMNRLIREGVYQRRRSRSGQWLTYPRTTKRQRVKP